MSVFVRSCTYLNIPGINIFLESRRIAFWEYAITQFWFWRKWWHNRRSYTCIEANQSEDTDDDTGSEENSLYENWNIIIQITFKFNITSKMFGIAKKPLRLYPALIFQVKCLGNSSGYRAYWFHLLTGRYLLFFYRHYL